jgi:sugar lactone lactonase YvrE
LSNHRTYANGTKAQPLFPDGICLDSDGALWVTNLADHIGVLRVLDGGELTHQVGVVLWNPASSSALYCNGLEILVVRDFVT